MLIASSLIFPPNTFFTKRDPFILISPTPRSGTTLLQRLLYSTHNALIYGEICASDLEFSLIIYAYKVQEYNFQREKYFQDLHKVLQGEVNDGILTLSPDVDGNLSALQAAAFAGVHYCRDAELSQDEPSAVEEFKEPIDLKLGLLAPSGMFKETKNMYLENLHQHTIAKYLNSEFEVMDGPSEEFKVKLVEVSNHANSPHQEVFSLLFHGPANHFMQQGIQKVKHKELGEMDIFLVPVGQDESGFDYEAVFNRIKAPK